MLHKKAQSMGKVQNILCLRRRYLIQITAQGVWVLIYSTLKWMEH